MNVIFTCGGTGGHINPAIAVANAWKERYPDSKILFVGGEGGLEEELVPKAGYALEVLPGGGLAHGKSLKSMVKNVKVQSANVSGSLRILVRLSLWEPAAMPAFLH